jgi:hypothetical protein
MQTKTQNDYQAGYRAALQDILTIIGKAEDEFDTAESVREFVETGLGIDSQRAAREEREARKAINEIINERAKHGGH